MDYRNIHGFNVANKLPSINPRNSASLDLTNNKIYKELQLCNESEKEPNEQQVDYNNEEMENNGEEEMANNQYEEEYEEMEEENIEQEFQEEQGEEEYYEEQGEEEYYEEQGEEEYYEEQGEEMEEQINYADNIPKLEHSFDVGYKHRELSPLSEHELKCFDEYPLSINGEIHTHLAPPKDSNRDFCLAYCVGQGEPYDKYNKTLEVMKRKPSKTPKVSTQEDNISNEQNKLLYMNNKPNANGYTVNNIDAFTIENDQRKTEDYAIDNQNSFGIKDLNHGWQYFKTYGKDDYRTIQKLGDEIRLYWEGIPENSRQNALNAYISDNTTEMNNIMNENFAQVTPYSSSSTNFNIFY